MRPFVGRCDRLYDEMRTRIELFGYESTEERNSQGETEEVPAGESAAREAEAAVEQDTTAQSQQT